MSLPHIIALSLTEIIGDTALKKYANDEGSYYLSIGVLSYIGVVILLIINEFILVQTSFWSPQSSYGNQV